MTNNIYISVGEYNLKTKNKTGGCVQTKSGFKVNPWCDQVTCHGIENLVGDDKVAVFPNIDYSLLH